MSSFVIALVLFACCSADQIFDPAQSYATGTGTTEGWTNTPSPFTFLCYDDEGYQFQTTPDNFSVEAYITDGVNAYSTEYEDNTDGTYSFWYVVPIIGDNYYLYVYSGETMTIGSPFGPIHIYGPSAEESYANGTGVSNGSVDEAKAVVIHARDHTGTGCPFGSDPFTIRAFQPNGEEFLGGSFSDNYDGTYTFGFTPTAHGQWHIYAQLDGVDIAGSPYTPVFDD